MTPNNFLMPHTLKYSHFTLSSYSFSSSYISTISHIQIDDNLIQDSIINLIDTNNNRFTSPFHPNLLKSQHFLWIYSPHALHTRIMIRSNRFDIYRTSFPTPQINIINNWKFLPPTSSFVVLGLVYSSNTTTHLFVCSFPVSFAHVLYFHSYKIEWGGGGAFIKSISVLLEEDVPHTLLLAGHLMWIN